MCSRNHFQSNLQPFQASFFILAAWCSFVELLRLASVLIITLQWFFCLLVFFIFMLAQLGHSENSRLIPTVVLYFQNVPCCPLIFLSIDFRISCRIIHLMLEYILIYTMGMHILFNSHPLFFHFSLFNVLLSNNSAFENP